MILWQFLTVLFYRERNVNGEALTVVKFAKIDSKTNITESDKAMFNLNHMEQVLTKKTDAMESQILAMDEKVRVLIREKNRDMAKNYLKRKKMMIVDLGTAFFFISLLRNKQFCRNEL